MYRVSVSDMAEEIRLRVSDVGLLEVSRLSIDPLIDSYADDPMTQAMSIFAGGRPDTHESLFDGLVRMTGCRFWVNPTNGNYMFAKRDDPPRPFRVEAMGAFYRANCGDVQEVLDTYKYFSTAEGYADAVSSAVHHGIIVPERVV